MIFIRITVAGSIFAHALLGCCWHHAHVCAEEPVAVSPWHVSPANVHSVAVGAADEDADHHHGCPDARCVVIRNELPGAWLLTAAAGACISMAPPCAAVAVHREGFTLDFRETVASPRIHLLHQILLI